MLLVLGAATDSDEKMLNIVHETFLYDFDGDDINKFHQKILPAYFQ